MKYRVPGLSSPWKYIFRRVLCPFPRQSHKIDLQIPTVSSLAQLVSELSVPQVDAPQTPKQVPEDPIEQVPHL
jgi:hypothetical protein